MEPNKEYVLNVISNAIVSNVDIFIKKIESAVERNNLSILDIIDAINNDMPGVLPKVLDVLGEASIRPIADQLCSKPTWNLQYTTQWLEFGYPSCKMYYPQFAAWKYPTLYSTIIQALSVAAVATAASFSLTKYNEGCVDAGTHISVIEWLVGVTPLIFTAAESLIAPSNHPYSIVGRFKN